ncbi:hypothetical protein [Variovorax soli]|uniref:Uncharacterized protein n=1 Tax=Variovorax soli TaxID=376815 RepID=A0ABU1NMV6_9BURK|nr:hypothetical protein [Variovorax soli]MDR6539789.1 hypothetical protein [Variovorax soli]
MRGYTDVTRSTSACVHFVEGREVEAREIEASDEFDEGLRSIRRSLDEARIRCAYVDCRLLASNPKGTCNAVGTAMQGTHRPYKADDWVRLLDDMITLSATLPGLVIVLDHADQLFALDRSQIFDLTEAFLIQFHHWFEKKKPCHLCFQMSSHPLVGDIFRDLP